MKPKIEKVTHSLIHSFQTCCVIDYYGFSDSLLQTSYSSESFAIQKKLESTVGMWKIKTFKNNYHAN